MKKLVALVLVLMVQASVAMGDSSTGSTILESARHSQWTSFILNLSNSINSRITTFDSNSKTTLAVDFYPGYCSLGSVKIIMGPNNPPVYGTATTKGQIRVDNREIINVDINLECEGKNCFVNVVKYYNGNILDDAKKGNIVRFKLEGNGVTAPIYMKYSLIGFTAAYSRATALCQAVTNIQRKNDDSQYFEPNYPPYQPPAKPQQRVKRDDEYFL